MPSLELIHEQKLQLQKALKHLHYSFSKIEKNNTALDENDDESLETWESFSSRFARVVDLFLAKFLRTFVLYQDPGFKGSMRDFINQGEKFELLDDSDWWLSLRELRNIAAHEYNEDDLANFYKALFAECPKLLKLNNTLQKVSITE